MKKANGTATVIRYLATSLEISLSEEELVLVKQLCLPYKPISVVMNMDTPMLRMRVMRLAAKMKVAGKTAVVIKCLKLGLIDIDDLVYQEYDGENLPGKSN